MHALGRSRAVGVGRELPAHPNARLFYECAPILRTLAHFTHD